MEKVIYNLVFNRKKQLNAEGKALIQVEAYLNRQKRYSSCSRVNLYLSMSDIRMRREPCLVFPYPLIQT